MKTLVSQAGTHPKVLVTDDTVDCGHDSLSKSTNKWIRQASK